MSEPTTHDDAAEGTEQAPFEATVLGADAVARNAAGMTIDTRRVAEGGVCLDLRAEANAIDVLRIDAGFKLMMYMQQRCRGLAKSTTQTGNGQFRNFKMLSWDVRAV